MDARLSRALRQREPVVGNWLAIGHPAVAEILALIEFDFVVIDTEHSAISIETTEELIRAVESVESCTEPLVRVADNDPIILKRTLDCGPAGVLVPMIESAAEAEAVVEATRYPPDGFRGVAGSRASDHGMDIDRYIEDSVDGLVRIVQLETAEGLDNAGEIAAVDGIDGVFIGPMDLSISLEMFKQWDDPEFRSEVESVIRAVHETGTSVGTLAATVEQAKARLDWETDFLVAGVDKAELIQQAQAAKNAFDAEMQRRSPPQQSGDVP